jgi:hypothetical protein
MLLNDVAFKVLLEVFSVFSFLSRAVCAICSTLLPLGLLFWGLFFPSENDPIR